MSAWVASTQHPGAIRPPSALETWASCAFTGGMGHARIYQQGKPASQSGRARADLFILEWESDRPKRPDPLMGWAGGADTSEQVRLSFPTLDAALAYAHAQGLEVEVVPPPAKRLILRSYADNFR